MAMWPCCFMLTPWPLGTAPVERIEPQQRSLLLQAAWTVYETSVIKCHGGQPNCVGMVISRQSWAECCTLIPHDIHGAGKHHSTPIAPVASFSHLVVRSRELSSPGLTTCTAVGPHQALHLLSVSRLRSNLQQTYHFYIFLFIFEGNSTK